MSTNSYLERTASELVLSAEEKISIGTSISTLETHLRNWEHRDSVVCHGCFGSYTRSTILPRRCDDKSDIDYMIQFDDTHRFQPQTYLNWLKDFANAYYSRSEIRQDFPTIALELNHIKFELVPAVKACYGDGLQIPAPYSLHNISWICTNPEQLRQSELEANRRCNYHLKPMIRLMKLWNIRQGRIVSSYELERTLASLSYVGCQTLEDYFFYAAQNLHINGLSVDNQIKLSSLQSVVSKISKYKQQGNEYLAGYLLDNLISI